MQGTVNLWPFVHIASLFWIRNALRAVQLILVITFQLMDRVLQSTELRFLFTIAAEILAHSICGQRHESIIYAMR